LRVLGIEILLGLSWIVIPSHLDFTFHLANTTRHVDAVVSNPVLLE